MDKDTVMNLRKLNKQNLNMHTCGKGKTILWCITVQVFDFICKNINMIWV